ncbi:transcriptional activator RinB [Staphylococcus haemolyticus]
MNKRILKNLFIIAAYELSKYLMNELIVKLQSEDDVDTFNQSDHAHLNMEVTK